MTDTIESPRIEEALEAIDRVLSDMGRRELVPSAEVTNSLLDVRSVLTGATAEPAGVH